MTTKEIRYHRISLSAFLLLLLLFFAYISPVGCSDAENITQKEITEAFRAAFTVKLRMRQRNHNNTENRADSSQSDEEFQVAGEEVWEDTERTRGRRSSSLMGCFIRSQALASLLVIKKKHNMYQMFFNECILELNSLDQQEHVKEQLEKVLSSISIIYCKQIEIKTPQASLSLIAQLIAKLSAHKIVIDTQLIYHSEELESIKEKISLWHFSAIKGNMSEPLGLFISKANQACIELLFYAVKNKKIGVLQILNTSLENLDFLSEVSWFQFFTIELVRVFSYGGNLLKLPKITTKTKCVEFYVLDAFSGMNPSIDPESLYSFIQLHSIKHIGIPWSLFDMLYTMCMLNNFSVSISVQEFSIHNMPYVIMSVPTLPASLKFSVRTKTFYIYMDTRCPCNVDHHIIDIYAKNIFSKYGVQYDTEKVEYYERRDLRESLLLLRKIGTIEEKVDYPHSCYIDEKWVNIPKIRATVDLNAFSTQGSFISAIEEYTTNVTSHLCHCLTFSSITVCRSRISELFSDSCLDSVENECILFLNLLGPRYVENISFENIYDSKRLSIEEIFSEEQKDAGYIIAGKNINFLRPSMRILRDVFTRYKYDNPTTLCIDSIDYFYPEVFDLLCNSNNKNIKMLLVVSSDRRSISIKHSEFVQCKKEKWENLKPFCTSKFLSLNEYSSLDASAKKSLWQKYAHIELLCDIASLETLRSQPIPTQSSPKEKHGQLTVSICFSGDKGAEMEQRLLSFSDIQLIFQWTALHFSWATEVNLVSPYIEESIFIWYMERCIEVDNLPCLQKSHMHNCAVRKVYGDEDEEENCSKYMVECIILFLKEFQSQKITQCTFAHLQNNSPNIGIIINRQVAKKLAELLKDQVSHMSGSEIHKMSKESWKKEYFLFLLQRVADIKKEETWCWICRDEDEIDSKQDVILLPCGAFLHVLCLSEYCQSQIKRIDVRNEKDMLNIKTCLSGCKSHPLPLSIYLLEFPSIDTLEHLSIEQLLEQAQFFTLGFLSVWSHDMSLYNISMFLRKRVYTQANASQVIPLPPLSPSSSTSTQTTLTSSTPSSSSIDI
ncbi:hypothetical protein NEFER03_1937 [Nematocida sp. LUAm3]|nr:hypothetical protein NEFER03_1937 [Nematocida sp. LUAm3]KAI5176161.1 hypothetical protein NEFER02_1975 [Nematocida sp. LUAm2]KAI5179255.1 hypothetical protein NEFER01_2107 [Nematocida sp. LUAm1]